MMDTQKSCVEWTYRWVKSYVLLLGIAFLFLYLPICVLAFEVTHSVSCSIGIYFGFKLPHKDSHCTLRMMLSSWHCIIMSSLVFISSVLSLDFVLLPPSFPQNWRPSIFIFNYWFNFSMFKKNYWLLTAQSPLGICGGLVPKSADVQVP